MEKKEISQIANDFAIAVYNTNHEKALQEMHRLHPTYQQILAGFILAWLQDFATNYSQDGRNTYSIAEVKKLMDAYNTVHPDEKLRIHFPCI